MGEFSLIFFGVPVSIFDKNCSYRNKCEFTVGFDSETNLPTVGMRCGKYMDGSTNVAPIGSLRHIPQVMKDACQVLYNNNIIEISINIVNNNKTL